MTIKFSRRSMLGAGAVVASGVIAGTVEVSHAQAAPAGSFSANLDTARTATNVTGVSAAYWDGAALHTAASGLRNSITGDPVTVDTVMHVGSITKVVNAALVMQLVDEGKIALDDPVLKHLPDLRLRDMQAAGRITCGMLINHTSGIDGSWLPEYGPDEERIVDTIARCADLGQLFPPGTETSYNNVATVIAGYLVQKLRGKSWYTLVKERIYEPLGMAHSLVDPLDVPRFRVSVGDLTNRETGKLFQTKRPFLATSLAPAGSTQMNSATDLVTFGRAMVNGGLGTNGGRILSAASAQRMGKLTAEFPVLGGVGEKVGLGWMIEPGGVLSHGGSGPGVRSRLYTHPASGRVLAVLTNCDQGEKMFTAFADPIVQGWTGLKPVQPKLVARPVKTGAYVGVFEDVADRYTVTLEDGALAVRTSDKFMTYDNSTVLSPPIRLEYVGDDTFRPVAGSAGDPDRLFRFIRPGAGGRMQYLFSWGRLMARSA